jgi:hypothetical protein
MKSDDWRDMDSAPLNPYGKAWGPKVMIWESAGNEPVAAYYEPCGSDEDNKPRWVVASDGTEIPLENAIAWMPIAAPVNVVNKEPGKGQPEPDKSTLQRIQGISDPWGYSRAAVDVLSERARQISEEGWTPDQDDNQEAGELAYAASCYATPPEDQSYPELWPWDLKWWKPKDRRSNLVRAGALIIAEIERVDRLEEITPKPAELQGETLLNGVKEITPEHAHHMREWLLETSGRLMQIASISPHTLSENDIRNLARGAARVANDE